MEFIEAIIAALISSLIWVVISVWPVMLIIGGIHHYWHAIPALGFAASALVCLLFSFLASKSNSVDIG